MVTGSGGGTGTPLTVPNTTLESLNYFEAIWYFDSSAGTYSNNTIEAVRYGGTAFTIFDGSSDYLYLGSSSKFDMAAFIMASAATCGTLTYEYSRADNTWTQFIPGEFGQTIISDSENAFDFSNHGAVGFYGIRNWSARAFSNTSPHTATVPDTTIRYWIRISASTVGSPTINQIQMRPYAYYCNPTDVANVLQLDVDFDATTNPSRSSVEDYIRAAQSRIDYTTQKSWRLNYKIDEEYDFNIHGIDLVERDIRRIVRLQIWDGSGWETKREGRTGDYFLIRDTGTIHFSRFFLLPARFIGPIWQWGMGEFNKPVRISYFYGKDIYADVEQGPMVFDICRKLAAINLLNNSDRSILLLRGADNVSFADKIRIYKDEIEEQLDRLKSWVIF